MGDAFIGAADDGASALFYNPAGLGSVRKFYAEPMNLTVLANKDVVGGLGIMKMPTIMSLSSLNPTLQSNPGIRPGVGGAYFPNFVFYGLAFGVLFQARQAAQYANEQGNIRYRTRWELIPTAGYGLRLASGIFKLGYSFQYVNAAVGDVTVPAAQASNYFGGVAQGAAFSHNLGFTLSLPVAYLPKVSLVARNIGGARYKPTSLLKVAQNPTGPPPTEKMSIDGAMNFEPRLTRRTKLNMNFQYRDATNTSGTPLLMRAALGFELGLNDFFFIRTGFSGGYPSFGIGVSRPRADIHFTYYNESLTSKFRGQKETIYMFQYQVRVF